MICSKVTVKHITAHKKKSNLPTFLPHLTLGQNLSFCFHMVSFSLAISASSTGGRHSYAEFCTLDQRLNIGAFNSSMAELIKKTANFHQPDTP